MQTLYNLLCDVIFLWHKAVPSTSFGESWEGMRFIQKLIKHKGVIFNCKGGEDETGLIIFIGWQ